VLVIVFILALTLLKPSILQRYTLDLNPTRVIAENERSPPRI
jgi:hypothetical protein